MVFVALKWLTALVKSEAQATANEDTIEKIGLDSVIQAEWGMF